MHRFVLNPLLWIVVLCFILLSGCAQQSLEGYAKEQPSLDLRNYFNGEVKAYGVFSDRSGQVIKRFEVKMVCDWRKASTSDEAGQTHAVDIGVLDEYFRYSDGSTQRRVWTLTRWPDGRYSGRADDVVDKAHGREAGNAFYWAYTLALPVDGRVVHVQFEDWMYLMNSSIMLNKARMSKWGVYLGEVTLTFVKP